MNAIEKISNLHFKFELGQPVSCSWGEGVVFARISYPNNESEENRYLILGQFVSCLGCSIGESGLTLLDNMPTTILTDNSSYQECADKAAWYRTVHSAEELVREIEVMPKAMFETLKAGLNQAKSELQIKMALEECFYDVYEPQNYGVESYAALLALLREAALNRRDVYHANGEKLEHINEFFDLEEAVIKVEDYIELLKDYDKARAKLNA